MWGRGECETVFTDSAASGEISFVRLITLVTELKVLNQCLLGSDLELNDVSIENQLAEDPQYKEVSDKNHIA